MTRNEQLLMEQFAKAAAAEAVAAAVAPLRKEIERLRGNDRELATNIRSSQSNITTHVDGTFDAVAVRDAQLVGALHELRAEVAAGRTETKTSIAPAAEAADAAKKQAIVAANEARSAGETLAIVKKSAARAAGWWRHPALPVVIYGIVDALWRVLGHG